MFWIVGLLLVLLFLGGLLRLTLFLRRRTDMLPRSEHKLGRERLLGLGLINMSFGAFGMYLLLTSTFEPMDILVGLSVVALVFEVGFRKGSINWAG